MTDETKLKLSVMVSLFECIQKSKQSSAKKRSKFRKLIDTFCKPDDYFSAVRLVLPGLDRERGSYGLKESILATCLLDALGISRESPDALRLFNWRKGGANTGANAGNFPLVAAEVLQRRQGMASGGLTVKELNDLLDQLASSENRAEKTTVLSNLIKKTNAQEMKWIIMIILKDLKLGISEKAIFHEFHPDAEDLFNVTCDLKLVCEKLRDRSQRHKRQDIEVGKAVRPQLAKRVNDAHVAWKKLHGKEVVVECKFDGDRIQMHKTGAEVHYFSRNFRDHSEYGPGMSDIILQNVLADRCILDGEMLVWDKSLNRFAEFGSNQEIAKAAKDGLDSDRQLCYVAFDVLYVGDTSVIHQSLKERQDLLQKFVKPLQGRLEILVPDDGINRHCLPGEPCWSIRAHNADDVESFFKETIENRDEGVVIKDLCSTWEPGDRSGKWMKLKPEYVHAGADLDVLIIGGYYGSGRRGGEVAQFLVGLAERPAPNAYPRRFISFCRVGTGLTDDELDAVVTKLKPYFRKYEYPKKAPPSFYQVTNNSKERPDVWIESPEKSIILSITSDIRMIRSEVFAAPYSLRFPRIDRVRYDKPWHECLDVQSFVELVHSSNGTVQKGKQYGEQEGGKPTRRKSSKRGEKKNTSVVPSHLMQTDISDIEEQSLIFANMMFYFVNVPPTHSLESLHKMVAQNGGTFAMNLNDSVTHCIAAESKGIKYQAAKLRGDVIHYSWLFDCCAQRKLLPLQPKYFHYISNSSKKKLQEDIDEFSDSYYWDLDLTDLKQLLSDIKPPADASTADDFRKYCPDDKWCLFYGCCIYFCPVMCSLAPDWEILLGTMLRRLKLEILMGGGKLSDCIAVATHLVVLTVPGIDMDLDFLLRSFTPSDKRLLQKKRLHLIKSQWLEDTFEMGKQLPEDAYRLKPAWLDIILEDSEQDIDANVAMTSLDLEGERKSSTIPCRASKGEPKERGHKPTANNRILPETPYRGAKRKRGSTATKLKREKTGVSQVHRQRARVAKKPARISEEKSEESSSCDETKQDGSKMGGGCCNIDERVTSVGISEHGLLDDSVCLHQAQDGNKVLDVEMSERKEKQEELFSRGLYFQLGERHNEEGERPQKLEVTVDPAHAMMLMDMIPSLGITKTDNISPTIVENKSAAETEEQPTKKKKVSYKGLASELLKDW